MRQFQAEPGKASWLLVMENGCTVPIGDSNLTWFWPEQMLALETARLEPYPTVRVFSSAARFSFDYLPKNAGLSAYIYERKHSSDKTQCSNKQIHVTIANCILKRTTYQRAHSKPEAEHH